MIPDDVKQYVPRGDFLLCKRVEYDSSLTLPSLGAVVLPGSAQGEVAAVASQADAPSHFEVVRSGPACVAAGVSEGDIVFLDATYCRVVCGNEIQLFYVGREKYGVLRLRAVAGHVRQGHVQ